jgi:CSLREA domain-containing protein
VKKVAAVVALAFCWVVVPATAGATTINVTSTADNKGDDGLCTLREAVDAANTNATVNPGGVGGDDCPAGTGTGEDTIVLAPSTTYTLTGAANDDNNASGDLDIMYGGGTVNFNGNWGPTEVPNTVIDGNGVDRILDIRPDAAQVGFFGQGLTLTHGAVTGGGSGGAVRIADHDAHFGLSTSRVQQNDAGGNGGAISFADAVDGYVFGISQVQFSQNNADEEGGAIWIDTPQDSNATVELSSFIENTAGTMGGAAYIESAGSTTDEPVLQFTNSTLTFNQAGTGGGAVAFDFGDAGTVFFKFSTIANNSASALGSGGGIHTNDAHQFVFFQGGTIISANAAGGVLSNCAGPGDFQTGGWNLESANSCHLSTAAPKFDLINTDPLLRMSRINPGGKETTETMGLFVGSPALDRIPTASCDLPEFDQRLVSRPQPLMTSNCDVGAFEGAAVALADAESDGSDDTVDNCPLDQNADQANNDADFQGDVCDPDDDNDAVLDAADNCPLQTGVPSNAGCPAPTSAPPSAQAPSGSTGTTVKKCKKKKKKRSAEAAKKKKCKKKKRK